MLDRVRAFLPEIAAANAALAEVDSNDINVEYVSDEDDLHVEMVRRASGVRSRHIVHLFFFSKLACSFARFLGTIFLGCYRWRSAGSERHWRGTICAHHDIYSVLRDCVFPLSPPILTFLFCV